VSTWWLLLSTWLLPLSTWWLPVSTWLLISKSPDDMTSSTHTGMTIFCAKWRGTSMFGCTHLQRRRTFILQQPHRHPMVRWLVLTLWLMVPSLRRWMPLLLQWMRHPTTPLFHSSPPLHPPETRYTPHLLLQMHGVHRLHLGTRICFADVSGFFVLLVVMEWRSNACCSHHYADIHQLYPQRGWVTVTICC
jgi:hypothetical protein